MVQGKGKGRIFFFKKETGAHEGLLLVDMIFRIQFFCVCGFCLRHRLVLVIWMVEHHFTGLHTRYNVVKI